MFSIKMKRAFAEKNGRIYIQEIYKMPTEVLLYFMAKLNIDSSEHNLIRRMENEISDKLDYNIWAVDQ